jgi:hypothetical protein
MGELALAHTYRSIFSPNSARQRAANFEDYWSYTLEHDGEILEAEQDLAKKKELVAGYQKDPIRSRRPLLDPESFYRNYVTMADDPETLDLKTRLLTFLYKFARHEWVGITAAWDGIPTMAESTRTTDKISRYHLCEEFSHVRLFHEVFRTFHLDKVEWVPLGKWMGRVYRLFPHFPEWMMSPPAFVSELMGLTLYLHTDKLIDQVFADEPEACARVHALLGDVLADELAHVGQRRNFLGPIGLRVAKWLVKPMYRLFFRDIPEAKFLFDVEQMVKDGLAFDYSTVCPDVLRRSWVPPDCVSTHQSAQPFRSQGAGFRG